MLTWIRRLFAPPVFEDDEDRTRVASLLSTLVLTVIAVALMTNVAAPAMPAPVVLFSVCGTVILLGLADLFLLHRGHVLLASILFLSGQWLSHTILMCFTGGITSVFAVGQFTATMFAGLLLGGVAAMAIAGLSIMADLGMLYLGNVNLLPEPLLSVTAGAEWLALTANIIAAVAVLYLADRSIHSVLKRAHSNQRAQIKANRELQAVRDLLETQVENRTRDYVARSAELVDSNRRLEETLRTSRRRADLLQASAQVSRAVAQLRDLNQLLSQVTHLISQHFGFYHVGVFLIDKPSQCAVLRAANSHGGQRMLRRQHKLRVGSEGIVGYVTGTGNSRVALDVGADAVFFDNPDLPDTTAEVAVPLRVGDEIIGALDVQSTEEAAFDEEAVTVLTMLADQIAIAIQNADLFQHSQGALAEAEEAYQRYLRQEWDSFLGAIPRQARRIPMPQREM